MQNNMQNNSAGSIFCILHMQNMCVVWAAALVVMCSRNTQESGVFSQYTGVNTRAHSNEVMVLEELLKYALCNFVTSWNTTATWRISSRIKIAGASGRPKQKSFKRPLPPSESPTFQTPSQHLHWRRTVPQLRRKLRLLRRPAPTWYGVSCCVKQPEVSQVCCVMLYKQVCQVTGMLYHVVTVSSRSGRYVVSCCIKQVRQVCWMDSDSDSDEVSESNTTIMNNVPSNDTLHYLLVS